MIRCNIKGLQQAGYKIIQKNDYNYISVSKKDTQEKLIVILDEKGTLKIECTENFKKNIFVMRNDEDIKVILAE